VDDNALVVIHLRLLPEVPIGRARPTDSTFAIQVGTEVKG